MNPPDLNSGIMPVVFNVYRGHRDSGGTTHVARNGKPFSAKASQQIWNHSPDGFEWGYSGSGPAQLALAILFAEWRDRKLALAWHQVFKFDVVSRWGQRPRDTWSINSAEIHLWYVKAMCKQHG